MIANKSSSFRPPLQGIDNVVFRHPNKNCGASSGPSSTPTKTSVVAVRRHSVSTDGKQTVPPKSAARRAKKKQRISENRIGSLATTKERMARDPNPAVRTLQAQPNAAREEAVAMEMPPNPSLWTTKSHLTVPGNETVAAEMPYLPSEIPTKQWLVLPQSKYGIHYELGCTMTSTESHGRTSGISMLHMAAQKSPFEMKMQQLRYLLQTKYPKGASLIYVREIFEPTDNDFGMTSSSMLPRPQSIDVTKLTRHQVDRIRLMVVDDQRRETMTSFMSFYQVQPFPSRALQAVDHFADFKTKYSKIRDFKMKFNRLFSFTFTLNRFDGWLYRVDRGWGRQRLVEGVALRWKNLLKCHTPEELGIDEEFSFQAVLALLQIFKNKVDSAPTFGDPQMVFKFE
jgi:hypothetical protein